MKIQPISPIHSILKYKKRDKNMNSWYEMRAAGEKVAVFGPITPDTLELAYDMVERTRMGLYRNEMLQIVAVGSGGWQEVVHEEHPTVFED